jgi:hypothetical protein
MYSILKTSHSHLAWVALAIIIISILVAAVSKFSNKSFSASHLKIALFGLILAHIQLLIGLALYFTSPFGLSNLSCATMKDSFARLLAVEHPFTNIIAIVLITIGYSKAKKAMGTGKAASSVLIFYSIGLLLILSRIPWSVWLKG